MPTRGPAPPVMRAGLDGERGAQPVFGQLFAHGSVYTIGTALQVASSALVIPILTRVLPPRQYGLVALFMIIFIVGGRLITLGLPTAIIRSHFLSADGNRQARRLSAATSLIATVVGACALIAAVPLTLESGRAGVIFGSVGTLLAAAGMLQSALAVLQAEQRPVPYVALSVAAAVFAQFVGVAAVLLEGGTAAAYLAGFAVGRVLVGIAGIVLTRPLKAGLPSRDVLRSALLKIGLPSLPAAMAIFLFAMGDRYVIGLLGSTRAVGRYQVAYAIGGLPTVLLTSLNTAWIAVVFRGGAARAAALARTSVAVMALVSATTVCLVLAAPLLLSIAAPRSYHPFHLVAVTALIAVATQPYVIYIAATQVIVWSGRTISLSWTTPLATAVDLLLVWIMYPRFGLAGAGAATAIATLLLAALAKRAADRTSEVVVWELPRLLLIGGGGMALTLAAVLLPSSGPMVGVRVAAAVAVALTAAAAVVRAIRVEASRTQLAGSLSSA